MFPAVSYRYEVTFPFGSLAVHTCPGIPPQSVPDVAPATRWRVYSVFAPPVAPDVVSDPAMRFPSPS